MSFPSTCDITIQFPIRNNAEITKQVLEVDPELSPDKVDKVFEVQDNQLIVHFKAVNEKTLRLAVSTFFDMVQVVIKGISEFSILCVCENKSYITALNHRSLTTILFLIKERTKNKEKTTNNSDDRGNES